MNHLICPNCRTPNNPRRKKCSVCKYDFRTGTSSGLSDAALDAARRRWIITIVILLLAPLAPIALLVMAMVISAPINPNISSALGYVLLGRVFTMCLPLLLIAPIVYLVFAFMLANLIANKPYRRQPLCQPTPSTRSESPFSSVSDENHEDRDDRERAYYEDDDRDNDGGGSIVGLLLKPPIFW